MLPNEHMDPLIAGAAEAVEESILTAVELSGGRAYSWQREPRGETH